VATHTPAKPPIQLLSHCYPEDSKLCGKMQVPREPLARINAINVQARRAVGQRCEHTECVECGSQHYQRCNPDRSDRPVAHPLFCSHEVVPAVMNSCFLRPSRWVVSSGRHTCGIPNSIQIKYEFDQRASHETRRQVGGQIVVQM